MNIQVAVLCDAATDENLKLNLLGAFDTICTPQLPAVHPQCSIALRLTFGHQDEGEHKLRLNFVDADRRTALLLRRARRRIGLPGSNGALWVSPGGNEADGVGFKLVSGGARNFSLCALRIFQLERVLAIRRVFDSLRIFRRLLSTSRSNLPSHF